jgi:putative endonuclease
MNNREKGNCGEQLAIKHIEKLGYTIVDTNYTSRFGEIDIIATDKNTTVFIEVKYRKNLKKGRPIEAVDYYKQKKIIRVAMSYAQKKKLYESPMRFDIIEVIGDKVRIVKNAFNLNGNMHYL